MNELNQLRQIQTPGIGQLEGSGLYQPQKRFSGIISGIGGIGGISNNSNISHISIILIPDYILYHQQHKIVQIIHQIHIQSIIQ